jgi:hypothetical protein
VLASGFSKLFTRREAAERFAHFVLGLKHEVMRVENGRFSVCVENAVVGLVRPGGSTNVTSQWRLSGWGPN